MKPWHNLSKMSLDLLSAYFSSALTLWLLNFHWAAAHVAKKIIFILRDHETDSYFSDFGINKEKLFWNECSNRFSNESSVTCHILTCLAVVRQVLQSSSHVDKSFYWICTEFIQSRQQGYLVILNNGHVDMLILVGFTNNRHVVLLILVAKFEQ